ncbi:MAG TPA: sigma-70 family RNA polymerase sigma factor [Thermoanaerobaculia bacterium]|nr:sigma-70 family RNA polymerase sigma factor [Thermoanaerobaculia bacterium]
MLAEVLANTARSRGVEWSEETTPHGGIVRLHFPPRPEDPAMTSIGEASPADLVRRIRSGDPRAEEELIARFGEGLTFLLRRWTRGHSDAEDLYQETFRLALEKVRRGEVRDPERLAGFLRSLARNLSIEHYRKAARRGSREEEIETAAEVTETGDTGQLGQLLRKEKVNLVRRLLEELGSERDRQILFRFYIAEDDKESIRSDLGLTAPEFNLVLFRARRRYRDLYERHAQLGTPRE